MNESYWRRAAYSVNVALTYLSRRGKQHVFSENEVHSYGTTRMRREHKAMFPGMGGVKRCLEMLAEGGVAERIVSGNRILYRRIPGNGKKNDNSNHRYGDIR